MPIGLVDLVQGLRHQERAHAVAGEEGQRRLEEVEPAERGELVEHQQEPSARRGAVGGQRLGEAASDLIEDQAHEGTRARDVGGWHHHVERDRPLGSHQIGNAPVRPRRVAGDQGIAVEAEQAHGGRDHAGALVVGLVQELAGNGGDDGVRFGPLLGTDMVGGQHDPQGAADGAGRIGEEGGDSRQRLLLLRVEHVQDGAGEQRVRGLLPVVAPLACPFRVDQDVGDVLHVAHLLEALGAPRAAD